MAQRAFSGPADRPHERHRVSGRFITHPPHRSQLAELAIRSRLPMLSWTDALSGALISYGPSSFDIHWRAGGYVAKILNGAKLGELPVEQPSKLALIINLKTAKALGLTIPRSVLLRADPPTPNLRRLDWLTRNGGPFHCQRASRLLQCRESGRALAGDRPWRLARRRIRCAESAVRRCAATSASGDLAHDRTGRRHHERTGRVV